MRCEINVAIYEQDIWSDNLGCNADREVNELWAAIILKMEYVASLSERCHETIACVSWLVNRINGLQSRIFEFVFCIFVVWFGLVLLVMVFVLCCGPYATCLGVQWDNS